MPVHKILVASDSFKGSLSTLDICAIAKKLIENEFTNFSILTAPIADGGEGSLDCLLSLDGAKKIDTQSVDPYLNALNTYYVGLYDKAFIEVAKTIGLNLVLNNENPNKTSSFGVGLQIKDAIHKGYSHINIALGGSCTNDGGAGLLSALGCKFFDEDNNEFIPTGDSLIKIDRFDASELHELIKNISFTCMCDVKNKATGKDGATYVFAPQKGAKEIDLAVLDKGMEHYCALLSNYCNFDVANIEGSGAAGAIAAGALALLNAKIESGFNTIAKATQLETLIKESSIVISGEGSLDSQSLNGKVLSSISKLTQKHNKKLIALVGCVDDSSLDLYYKAGIDAIFTINRESKDFIYQKDKAPLNYENTLRDILKVLSF